jgi:hypothetical protein
MKGFLILFTILIVSISILWLNTSEPYEDMGKAITDAANPLAQIARPLKNPTGLVNTDPTTSANVRQLYSVAMPGVSPALPAYTPKQDNTGQLLADLKFCNTYPTTLSATANPFTDGPSSDRFNQMCGMCMTEGRLVTGEKFPNKGSPGPPGTGIVVYPEDKQVAGTSADAIPSFSCAHCAPIFLDSPIPNVRPVAINSEQYVATLQYIAENDLIYDNGCTTTKSDSVQCNNPDKKIAELNLFYGGWNEGTCGQVSESDGNFNPIRNQSTDNLGCYGKADCNINFSPTVLATKEWEIEGRCDFMAPPLHPATHTLNVDCLPVILSEAPSPPIAGATPVWAYDVTGNGRFKFTRDYKNPSTTKSFKAILNVCLWNTTGKVFLNGKAVSFKSNGADVERISGSNTTNVTIPIGTSRISVHTEQTSYATPSVSLNLANQTSPSNYVLVTDRAWVYVIEGYRQSFPTVNGYCGFIPSAYAGHSDLAALNGNQEALANHWITKGLYEGRSPCGSSCGFDDGQYHCINLDVQAAGMDPKTHYVQYGFREGRKIRENGCAPCQPPPKVRVYEHCNKAGWSTTFGGGIYATPHREYRVNSDFNAGASYITVDAGITAVLVNNRNFAVKVVGPGEFNFCELAGFNDGVIIIAVGDNALWPSHPTAAQAINDQRRAEEARRRAEEEERRRAEEQAERARRQAEEIARQQREAMEGVGRAARAAAEAASNTAKKCTIM